MESHGFVEIEVAKLLGFSYDEYSEGDSKAALVSKNDLERYVLSLKKIHVQSRDDSVIEPRYILSNTAGIGMAMTKYCTDDNFMDDFTPGPAKETTRYMAIVSLGTSSDRFNKASFLGALKNAYNEVMGVNADAEAAVADATTTITEAAAQVQENAVPAPEPVAPPAPPEKTPDELEREKSEDVIESIINEIHNNLSSSYKRVKRLDSGRCLVSVNGGTSRNKFSEEALEKMSNELDKHIIVISGTGFNTSRLIKINDRDIAIKHIIVLFTSVGDMGKFNKVGDSAEKVPHLCLGSNVYSIFAPAVTTDTKSTLGDYDAVFKDTVTNVMFALRKSFMIYILVPPTGNNPEEFFSRVADELIRRWKGGLSMGDLRKIDLEYHRLVSEDNKGDYIEFCKINSNSYIQKIETVLSEAIDDIGKLQKELFEKSKMYRQYFDIVEYFDKDKHDEEVTAEAMQNFDSVSELPQVNSVFVRDNKIHVYTNIIYAKDPRKDGKIHELGTFHIQLGMMSPEYNPENSVVIKNTMHRATGFSGRGAEAPHIFDNGKMCHGNLVNSIVEHYKNRDLYGVIMDLIIFLESVNTDDAAGRTINQWPVVDKIPEPESMKAEPEVVVSEAEQAFDDELMNLLSTPILTRS